MSDLFIQIQDFFLTLALGICAGFIFHYYQSIIAQAKVGKYPLYILDFFLWIFMICIVFFAMLWINHGEMRLYVLIALVMGILIYYYFFRNFLQNPVTAAANLTIKVARLIKRGLNKLQVAFNSLRKLLIIKRKKLPPNDNGA